MASPSSEIIGEGADIFTDMTETILDALDQQLAVPSEMQKPKGLPIKDDLIKGTQGRTQTTSDKNRNKTGPTQQNNTLRPHITVPYYRGLSESVKQRCKNYGGQVYFRGGTTIKNLLMAPKDLDPMMKKSGVIYSYKCGRVECDEEYIGESSRTFGERFKEHQKAPSPIFDHFNNTGHSISVDKLQHSGEGGPEPQESHKRSSLYQGQ